DDQFVGVGGDVALGPEQVGGMDVEGGIRQLDLLAPDHGHAADNDDGGRGGEVGHLDVDVDDRHAGVGNLHGFRREAGVDQDGVELPFDDAELAVHRDLVGHGDVQAHLQVVAGIVARVLYLERVDRNRAEDDVVYLPVDV